jgi:acetyl esterase/lipase
MKLMWIVCFFVPLFFAFEARAQSHPDSRLNIRYVSSFDTLQQLDVFWAPQTNDSPVLVFFHGGGFLSGNKADYRTMAAFLSQKGIVVVLVNYRLSPKVKYPYHEEDAAAAVAWVFQNIHDYGGSKEKIYLMGHSAGGQLATLLVSNKDFLRKYNIDQSNIKGVITVGSVFEVKTQEGGATPKYLETVYGADPTIWAEASCKSHLNNDEKLPPFLVAWSSEDHPLIIKESSNFIEILRRQRRDFKTYVFEGGGHNAFQNELTDSESDFSKLVHQLVQ